MIPRSFYFLRHGETDANVARLLQGHIDIPLNDKGRDQAHAAAKFLKEQGISRIISSTLSRASETAEIVNSYLNLPIEYDARIMEKSFGLYEGFDMQGVKQWEKDNNYIPGPVEIETGYAVPPEGETYITFHGRLSESIKDALHRYPDDTILFVSHGGVFRALYYSFFGTIKETKNANPYHFHYADDKWSLECLVTKEQS